MIVGVSQTVIKVVVPLYIKVREVALFYAVLFLISIGKIRSLNV